MKIIKPGVIKKKVFSGTCGSCGCIIEAERDEIQWLPGRPGERGDGKVQCPTCKGDIFIYP